MKRIIFIDKKMIYFILTLLLIITGFLSVMLVTLNHLKNPLDDGSDNLNQSNSKARNNKERTNLIKTKYNEKKIIALTFDDGPSRYTEKLLDELKARDVVATFFILGVNAEQREDVLTKIAVNNTIAIHCYSHKLFTRLKNEKILEEILKTQEIIAKNTNISPTIIRPPYGAINNRIKKLFKENEFINVNWTIDSKDWRLKNADKIYKYVISKVKGNDIILMHDTFKSSIDSALRIIDTLKEDGYLFVTINEFIQVQNQS